MATQPTTTAPLPVRHIYNLNTSKKFKEVRHYFIDNVVNDTPILKEEINVSKDRQFSKAKNICYWLKHRNTNDSKWSKAITGFKPTQTPGVYFGDIPEKAKGRYEPKDLLIFRFTDNAETLVIDVYRNFYTDNTAILQNLIKTGLK